MTKFKKIKNLNDKSFFGQTQWFLISTLIVIVSFLVLKPIFNAQAQEDEQTEASEESTILNIKKVIDKQVELGQGGQETQEIKQAYLAQVKRVSAETLTVLNNNVNIVIPLTEGLEIIKEEEN